MSSRLPALKGCALSRERSAHLALTQDHGAASRITDLLEGGADPTIPGDEGRTAYTVATKKAVRDVFRRYMAAHPEQWDWGASGVPSALTPELQAHQAAKQVGSCRPDVDQLRLQCLLQCAAWVWMILHP